MAVNSTPDGVRCATCGFVGHYAQDCTSAVARTCAKCCVGLGGRGYITDHGLGEDYCGSCYTKMARATAAVKTDAPAELVEFFQRCKALRMRQGKGEFVASDGTRMPYDFVFERDEKPARKGDDE